MKILVGIIVAIVGFLEPVIIIIALLGMLPTDAPPDGALDAMWWLAAVTGALIIFFGARYLVKKPTQKVTQ